MDGESCLQGSYGCRNRVEDADSVTGFTVAIFKKALEAWSVWEDRHDIPSRLNGGGINPSLFIFFGVVVDHKTCLDIISAVENEIN